MTKKFPATPYHVDYADRAALADLPNKTAIRFASGAIAELIRGHWYTCLYPEPVDGALTIQANYPVRVLDILPTRDQR